MKPDSKDSKEKYHQMNEQPAVEAVHRAETAVQAILEEYKFCC